MNNTIFATIETSEANEPKVIGALRELSKFASKVEISQQAPGAKQTQAVSYLRAPETRGQPLPYEQKFANLIQLCKEQATTHDADVVVVSHVWVLGDDYEEISRTLSLIAEAQLSLCIATGAADFGDAAVN